MDYEWQWAIGCLWFIQKYMLLGLDNRKSVVFSSKNVDASLPPPPPQPRKVVRYCNIYHFQNSLPKFYCRIRLNEDTRIHKWSVQFGRAQIDHIYNNKSNIVTKTVLLRLKWLFFTFTGNWAQWYIISREWLPYKANVWTVIFATLMFYVQASIFFCLPNASFIGRSIQVV